MHQITVQIAKNAMSVEQHGICEFAFSNTGQKYVPQDDAMILGLNTREDHLCTLYDMIYCNMNLVLQLMKMNKLCLLYFDALLV